MFLTIENGKLVAYANDADERSGASVVITTADDLATEIRAAMTAGDDVMASSSVDFPEEYTSDPNTLALVALLNGPFA